MGTSRNDPSPPTPSWKTALAVLGRTDVSVDMQVREVCRAAAQDRHAGLGRDLSHPLLATAWELSRQGLSAQRALETYDDAALHVANVGLAVEFGRRALARCTLQGPATTSFPAELFREVFGYYVARDLPTVVAAKGRVSAVSDAIQLKSSIRNLVRSRVSDLGEPSKGPAGWKTFVAKVTDALQKKEAHR
jgi:hypothetical protein